jgi:methionine-rich copper-binding protein CopC
VLSAESPRPLSTLNSALVSALLLGLALAAVATPAWAHHVRIVRSEPAAGARLNEPPSAVLVLFDQPVAFPGSGLQVTNERGVRVDRSPTAPSAVDEASLALELPPLPSGGYTVTWRVTSRADGEFNEGSFGFTVLPDLRPLVFDRSRLGGLGVVLFTLGALGMLGAMGHRHNPPTSID